ncbi:MAG: hypothetical protein RIC53_13840 [Cyclobacteriaceae bacterium]
MILLQYNKFIENVYQAMLLRNLFYLVILTLIAFVSCNDEELPPIENEEEVITDVDLIFSPVDGGAPLTFGANDPDGEGPEDMVTDPIVLGAENSYQLFIKVRNDIDNVDLTEEIKEEGAEHMFFFGFTDELFDQPEGNGNIDSRTDQVNYIDEDENGLPIGLITGWQTSSGGSGTLRIVLKHQPDVKTATSGIDVGSTDIDLTFDVTVE